MAKAAENTIRLLAQSNNLSASQLLMQALRSSHDGVRQEACRYIMRDPQASKEFVRHFNRYPEQVHETLLSMLPRLVPVVRAAIRSKESDLRQSGYQIAQTLRVIEIIPDLIEIFLNAAKEDGNSMRRHPRFFDTLFGLLNNFDELDKSDAAVQARINPIVLNIGNTLMKTLASPSEAIVVLWMQIFLQMYPLFYEQKLPICGLMTNATHPWYDIIARFLIKELPDEVSRFIWDQLQRPKKLLLIIQSTLIRRSDLEFWSQIFQFLSHQPVSEAVVAHLHLLEGIVWAKAIPEWIPHLSAPQLVGLATFLRYIIMSPTLRMTLLTPLIEQKTSLEARVIALKAIPREEPNDIVEPLIFQSLNSSQPAVQIAALSQLKWRNMPQALVILMKFAESPIPEVRHAVGALLPDLRLSRWFDLYDSLPDAQRESLCKMVLKVDSNIQPQITAALMSSDFTLQEKALRCVYYGKNVIPYEEQLMHVASTGATDKLRVEAVYLLMQGQRTMSRHALVQILHRDPSSAVREAAKKALERRPVATFAATENEAITTKT